VAAEAGSRRPRRRPWRAPYRRCPDRWVDRRSRSDRPRDHARRSRLDYSFVVLAHDGNRILVYLLVEVEQMLGHHVQEMRQASSLCSVLVMKCTKRERLVFDARVASGLGGLGEVVGAHAGDFGYAWFWGGSGKWRSY
jgi:hypothetical protein